MTRVTMTSISILMGEKKKKQNKQANKTHEAVLAGKHSFCFKAWYRVLFLALHPDKCLQEGPFHYLCLCSLFSEGYKKLVFTQTFHYQVFLGKDSPALFCHCRTKGIILKAVHMVLLPYKDQQNVHLARTGSLFQLAKIQLLYPLYAMDGPEYI